MPAPGDVHQIPSAYLRLILNNSFGRRSINIISRLIIVEEPIWISFEDMISLWSFKNREIKYGKGNFSVDGKQNIQSC